MSSSLVKIGKRRIHKERSQPQARARFGLLEKHSDYVQRARDYHRKRDHLQHLRELASFRNPDEFYFAMVGGRTIDGVHRGQRRIDPGARTAAALKRFTDQDLAYLQTKAQEERRRIQKLQSALHLLRAGGGGTRPSHTLFVDRASDADEFDAARHFDTLPSMVRQTFFRPRLSQLGQHVLRSDEDVEAAADAGLRQYRLLDARLNRLDQMEKEIATVQLRKHLMGRGQARKLSGPRDQFGEEDASAPPTYVWRAERKR